MDFIFTIESILLCSSLCQKEGNVILLINFIMLIITSFRYIRRPAYFEYLGIACYNSTIRYYGHLNDLLIVPENVELRSLSRQTFLLSLK